jgi:hypothetical protein
MSLQGRAVVDLFLQVGVFSATLPPEALEITRKFMNKPVRILVKRDELTLEGIKQVGDGLPLQWGGQPGQRTQQQNGRQRTTSWLFG